MTGIQITTEGNRISVRSPYHPDFPTRARELGGKYTAGTWTFDGRDERRVRDLCVETWGTDGTPTKVVTVRVDLSTYPGSVGDGYQTQWLAGRQICHRPGRDDRVRLGEGVVLVEGGFDPRGGSVKNPALGYQAGTVLEVRDVPAGHPDLTLRGVTVLDEDDKGEGGPDVDALRAERKQLLARLTEIDALLGEPQTVAPEPVRELVARLGVVDLAARIGVTVRTVRRWITTTGRACRPSPRHAAALLGLLATA